MTKLTINDLEMSKELDSQEMADTVGGLSRLTAQQKLVGYTIITIGPYKYKKPVYRPPSYRPQTS